MRNKKSIKFAQKLTKTLDISEDIFLDIPRFTMNDNRELQIENYKGILSYDFNEIRLGAKNYVIKIEGLELKISVITDDSIVICGKIYSVSFPSFC